MQLSQIMLMQTICLCFNLSQAFLLHKSPQLHRHQLLSHERNINEDGALSRRDAVIATFTGAATITGILHVDVARAEEELSYIPAKRATAYFVDTTQPPTMIPIPTAQKEKAVLARLGLGSGTEKEAIKNDTINLNNMLNKAVFGTITAVTNALGQNEQEVKMAGPGYASFLCLGMPAATKVADVELATSLMTTTLKARKGQTALALALCPLSCQATLDEFSQSGDAEKLISALASKGVPSATASLYMPIFTFARSKDMKMLAASPELEDIKTARQQGLQNVDPDRRSQYVVDAQGFIALSTDPKFRLYADRSLLKDFQSQNSDDKPGNFFAERILVHETAATVAARYAAERPDSMVVLVAPTPDLRFLNGMNGRIPRVCQYFNGADFNKVTENAVTTILLNPTAEETLSKSRYLRLEIGTGPDTLQYQSKVSDYLWFSSSPKVNMLPRMMNPQ